MYTRGFEGCGSIGYFPAELDWVDRVHGALIRLSHFLSYRLNVISHKY